MTATTFRVGGGPGSRIPVRPASHGSAAASAWVAIARDLRRGGHPLGLGPVDAVVAADDQHARGARVGSDPQLGERIDPLVGGRVATERGRDRAGQIPQRGLRLARDVQKRPVDLRASHGQLQRACAAEGEPANGQVRGVDLQVAPMLVLGLVAVAFAWFRGRDRLILGLASCALGWWVLVVAMTLDGYPGLERFYLPAAGVTCVLAGVGVVQLARAAGDAAVRIVRERRGGGGGRECGGGREGRSSARPVAVGAAVAVIAISIPFSTTRIDSARAQQAIADRAVTHLDQLSAAVAAVGGHHAVYPCHSSFAAVNHGVQTALAFKLQVTLSRVGTTMRHPGVLFVGPHDSIDGGPAPISHGLDQIRLLAQTGVWRVYQVWRTVHLTACVGR